MARNKLRRFLEESTFLPIGNRLKHQKNVRVHLCVASRIEGNQSACVILLFCALSRCVFRRDRTPSTIPVKELTRLSQKAQKVRVFGWKGIRTNTPLSPKFIIISDTLHGYKTRHV